MEYMEEAMDRQIEGAQIAEEQLDLDAIAWAYGKCVALGLENGSVESAMMMDRLKMLLGGYGA